MSVVSGRECSPTPSSHHHQPADSGARLRELLRAMQRQLRRKGTMIEKALMYRAASMTLRAELAVADPAATLTDITRADNVARRARQDFERAITRTAPAKPPASIKEALRRG